MQRNFRFAALTLASLLALTPLAGAQQSSAQQSPAPAQPGQPGTMPPRAGQGMPAGQMPVAFTLVRKVDGLNVIGKNPKTAFSKAQAAQLVTLLEPLKTAKTLTAAQASSVSASIDQLLTAAQRPALKLAESQMGGGRMQGGQRQGTPGQPGQMQGGQPGNNRGAGTPNGQPQGGQMPNGRMQRSQMNGGQMNMAPDANPFLSPRGGQILSTLLASLKK